MTIRGLIILILILILIPVFLGKVSISNFWDLLKSPTNVTLEQWKSAIKELLSDVISFYKSWAISVIQKILPKVRQKLEKQGIDTQKILEENKQFIKEGLEIVKPPETK